MVKIVYITYKEEYYLLSKIFIMRLLNNLDMDYSYTVSDYFWLLYLRISEEKVWVHRKQ